MGALTMLNEAGDTTISWTEDRDGEMEEIIKKKMAEGVTFFVIAPRRGKPPAVAKRGGKLENVADAKKQRTLVIPDEDLAKFVASGAGTVEKASNVPVSEAQISRDPKQVARSESVGVKQRRGG